MFIPDDVVQQDVSDALQQASVNTVAINVLNLATRAHSWAYNFIVQVLAGRGYTLAQIIACDWGADVERDLTSWKALSLTFVNTQIGQEMLKNLDRREELKTMPVITAGAFVSPVGPQGTAQTGAFDTSQDTFVWPSRDRRDHHPGPPPGHDQRF